MLNKIDTGNVYVFAVLFEGNGTLFLLVNYEQYRFFTWAQAQ